MLELLNEIDTSLFFFINGLNNSFLDFLFYWISQKWIWIPFYAFLAWMVYKTGRSELFIVMVFIAIAITISDQVASTVLKPMVMRLRPCHDPAIAEKVHLVKDYCGGRFGFVSSHAANVFALATFLGIFFSGRQKILMRIIWSWAVIVSISRVYLGVHYPGDIIGGALIGIFSGYVCVKCYMIFSGRRKQRLN